MDRFRWLAWGFLPALVVSMIGLPHLPAEAPAAPAQPARPRLAVLIVFDQMRGDYLQRWEELFEEGGFRRLLKEGVWFQNCHYPYANTVTAAGHASLATGSVPARHGIIANEWFDRATGEPVTCVDSNRYERVPPLLDDATSSKLSRKKGGASPERLLLPTLADALREATAGKCRVVSLAGKERSAVLPGGKQPDACYWLDGNVFATSTYYRDQVHPWVAAFNELHPADRWFGKDWNRLRPDLDYGRYSGPDDVVGEGKGIGQGRTFPHPMTGGPKDLTKEYYKALFNSPFGNELLLALAKSAIDAEGLGTHGVPDLLCLSFSCNDPIGHCWGPDSQEVLDVTLRSDLIIKELLAHLDARVGKGNYVVMVSADHGVCQLPEVARAEGKDAGRIAPAQLRAKADQFLDETFGPRGTKTSWFESGEPAEVAISPWMYFNRKLLQERRLPLADAEEVLAGWLKNQPGIRTAYTRTQLLRDLPPEDTTGRMVQRSFHPERSGDVALVLKPYWIVTTYLTGTTHGTPNPQDTHVPLIVYGPGIRSGVRKDAVTPQTGVVILSELLGIKPPAGANATLPEGVVSAPAGASGR